MTPPWRGGLLFLLLLAQDPPAPRPDPVARFAAILESGPEDRRDLAARALSSLGRPGHEALRRLRKPAPETAPAVALLRIPSNPEDEFWKGLDSSDPDVIRRSRTALRGLYSPPDAPAGRPSAALQAELDRRRSFDVQDRALADVLRDLPVSWILMSPRNERVTLRLRDVTTRDFLRAIEPNLAAVPVGDLLVLIPPDRIATVEPPPTVWAPAELAPRIESALEALGRGEEGPINGLTGVAVYHALKLSPHARRAEDVRRLLEQRIFFVGLAGNDEGAPVTLNAAPSGRESVAAFEKAAGVRIEVQDRARLDAAIPAFRFNGIPAKLAARALAFRINRVF